ncbi:PREDICTED: protein monoglycylase TTLL8 [Elephantulus edwardii]|uniref:protein monoglycylase TTLL8 n=1 Tax=Elephantulus edwardii TaxID=28737 RepID=UPI0003F0BF8E|nr:PREDICTED: protein monoglycylase TTLL8 [Elephantulus edwardii]
MTQAIQHLGARSCASSGLTLGRPPEPPPRPRRPGPGHHSRSPGPPRPRSPTPQAARQAGAPRLRRPPRLRPQAAKRASPPPVAPGNRWTPRGAEGVTVSTAGGVPGTPAPPFRSLSQPTYPQPQPPSPGASEPGESPRPACLCNPGAPPLPLPTPSWACRIQIRPLSSLPGVFLQARLCPGDPETWACPPSSRVLGRPPARSLPPVDAGAMEEGRDEPPGNLAMEPEHAERKRASCTLSGEDRKDNRPKRGISQDLTSFPKLDRYRIARQLTEKAVREKKIFSIYGHYPVIRATLRRKGWVEKKFHFLPKGVVHLSSCDLSADSKGPDAGENSDMIVEDTEDIHDVMSRLVKHEMPYFLWTIKRDVVDYHNLSCDQMLNHYGKTASFTTKIGLCVNMRSLPWYVQANPDCFFPRCYGLCTESEKQEFLNDFRRTAAFSILKWVVSHQNGKGKSKSKQEDARDSDRGCRKDADTTEAKELMDLPEHIVDTACKVCQTYLEQLEHMDIDTAEDAAKDLTEDEWNDLTQQYYSLVHGGAVISNLRNYLSQCQTLLNRIASINPQTEIDGTHNIWIIKPAAKSRGRDIVCMDRVEEILELVAADHLSAKDNKWVAQKYIETPLLIYDTKFDIRQWFLVTDWNPLTIWFYKESYLRFSTQRFSLDNLDSAIHLCNNSIQKHLKNAKDRSPLLPGHNMWTSTKFQEYLQRRGRGPVWASLIYPSMKRVITHTMKVAQDRVQARKNSFELYGADFVLGRDFKPWLIEINSSPSMHPSTPVTAQLCAQVQEDTLKVVVDRRVDRNCDIGNFELLWRQPAVELPPFSGSDLCVEGVSFRKGKKQASALSRVHLAAPSLPAEWSCLGPEPRAWISAPDHLQSAEQRVPGAALARAWPSKCTVPTVHVQMAAPRSGKVARGPWGRPRDLASTCLVCCGPFQPAQPCKRCRSFGASVQQGASFLPLGDGQGGR